MTDNNTFLGNIEAEEAILGGILLDPTAISIIDIHMTTTLQQSQTQGTWERFCQWITNLRRW